MPAPYTRPTRQAFCDDGLWKLPLSKGFFSIIDSWDAQFLSQWNWTGRCNKWGSVYAVRTVLTPFGSKEVALHRMVAVRAGILTSTNLFIDHKNLDSLDNRSSNLRISTNAQNCSNKRARKDNSTGIKGVYWATRESKWRAYITVRGVYHHLGYTDTAEEAAALYAEASKRLHGEFGRTD